MYVDKCMQLEWFAQKKETESVEKERIQTKTPSLPVSDSESRHD